MTGHQNNDLVKKYETKTEAKKGTKAVINNIINSIEDILVHKDHYPWADDEHLMNQFYNGYPAIHYVVKYGRFDLFKIFINTTLYFDCDLFDTWVGNADSEMLCYYNEKLIQYNITQVDEINDKLLILQAENIKLSDDVHSINIKNNKLTTELERKKELIAANINDKKKYQNHIKCIVLFEVLLLSIVMVFFNQNN